MGSNAIGGSVQFSKSSRKSASDKASAGANPSLEFDISISGLIFCSSIARVTAVSGCRPRATPKAAASRISNATSGKVAVSMARTCLVVKFLLHRQHVSIMSVQRMTFGSKRQEGRMRVAGSTDALRVIPLEVEGSSCRLATSGSFSFTAAIGW